ncbi:hypothetical protein PLESTF_000270300 [Pleodorina starrii]|nr:hypothetical protein PLESTM_001223100 [Pleodorina starrii]GLC65266.1 hypothetical protein PLESTF_000270300 [Pleodorina starrii]
MLLTSRRLQAGTSRVGFSKHSTFVYKPISAGSIASVAPTRGRVGQHTAIKAQLETPRQERLHGLRGPQNLELSTIFAKGPNGKMMKANVILPPSQLKDGKLPTTGESVRAEARGVVLFMHGFAQGPTAYARMLTQVAAEADAVVVAPCPPFAKTPGAQQKSMVDAALFWRDLIAKNKLPCLELTGETNDNVGLMGHSVGGGLAAFVADAAAQRGQAFTCAHVMAPQTSKIVEDYNYNSKKNDSKLLQNVATEWSVQYGCIDLLSNVFSVQKFRSWLSSRQVLRSSVKYELGTHVGFEDQLVVGRESFTANFLPWVLAIMWGTVSLWLPWLGLQLLSRAGGNTLQGAPGPSSGAGAGAGNGNGNGNGAVQLKEGMVPDSPGFGPLDDVSLLDERTMAAGYILLAATVTYIETLIPGFAWTWDWGSEALRTDGLSVLKAVLLVLAVGSWPAIVVYPYQAVKQRPEARVQAATYFKNVLVVGAKPQVKVGAEVR